MTTEQIVEMARETTDRLGLRGWRIAVSEDRHRLEHLVLFETDDERQTITVAFRVDWDALGPGDQWQALIAALRRLRDERRRSSALPEAPDA